MASTRPHVLAGSIGFLEDCWTGSHGSCIGWRTPTGGLLQYGNSLHQSQQERGSVNKTEVTDLENLVMEVTSPSTLLDGIGEERKIRFRV